MNDCHSGGGQRWVWYVCECIFGAAHIVTLSLSLSLSFSFFLVWFFYQLEQILVSVNSFRCKDGRCTSTFSLFPFLFPRAGALAHGPKKKGVGTVVVFSLS